MVEAVNFRTREEICCVEDGSKDENENGGHSLYERTLTKEFSANDVDVPSRTMSSLHLHDTYLPTRCQKRVLCGPGLYARRDVGGALFPQGAWPSFWASGVGGCWGRVQSQMRWLRV